MHHMDACAGADGNSTPSDTSCGLTLGKDCTGCQHLLQLRCRYSRQMYFYHRILDCVIPLLLGLEIQLPNVSKQGLLCLLGERDVLYPFVRELWSGGREVRFVDDRTNAATRTFTPTHCSCRQLRFPVQARWVPYNNHEPGQALCNDRLVQCSYHTSKELMLKLHAVIVRAGLLARVDDSGALALSDFSDGLGGAALPRQPVREIVLITRTGEARFFGHPLKNSTRAFSHGAIACLMRALEGIPSAATRLYSGSEDVRTTLQLFARARAVVGFHGAGLVNALFAVAPVVVVEVTTWILPRVTWRTNRAGVLHWSFNMDWVTHHIDCEELLSSKDLAKYLKLGNQSRERTAVARNMFLASVGAINISEQSAKIIGRIVQRAKAWNGSLTI